MTSEAKNRDRRNTALAAVIGAVLATYASGAAALEFEMDNGAKINWNTTLSVGSSWRAQSPSNELYTRADGAAIGHYSGTPMLPGQPVPKGDGVAGNQAAGDGNLNWGKGERFTTPFKLVSDVELKKDRFGALVRFKAWYDEALMDETVRYGHQNNNFNGERPGLGPVAGYTLCPPGTNAANCMANSLPGHNVWPRRKMSDSGFEAEQKFSNVMLLDAYLYGSFGIGDTDLQLRLGNQVVNWGESIFIQGVNQINPIDVPAARRAGAELKEVLLPVPIVYANWGFSLGSVEAFYQLKWDNTSVDSCGNYWSISGTLISSQPKACGSATVLGGQNGNLATGTTYPYVPQLGAQPWLQGNGTYVPDAKGMDAKDGGQYGIAFRFPVDKLDTEFGLYAMNIHSRLPYFSTRTGTNPTQLDPNATHNATYQAALASYGITAGADSWGPYWKTPASSLRFRNLIPAIQAPVQQIINGVAAAYGWTAPTMKPGTAFWVYPEDIKVFGLSAATNLFGWSVSAEYGYTKDQPVQINGNDFTAGGTYGIGPEANRAKEIVRGAAGTFFRGYDRFDKQQFQVNTVKTFGNLLGADNVVLIGEVASQWNDVPDYTKGGIRYGRGFMYGNGSGEAYGPGYGMDAQAAIGLGTLLQGNVCSPTLSGAPVPVANPLYNGSPHGCKNDGFVTDFAWGYRLRVSADYINAFNSGVTVTPSLYWAQDVSGVSMDPAFIEGRQQLGLGAKFSYAKRYTFELNYVTYKDGGFDPLFDRDFYSASVAVTF